MWGDMAGISLGWWIRLGLAGCAVALLAVNWAVRRSPTATVSSEAPVAAVADDADESSGAADASDDSEGPLLVNDGWHIRKMATAQGAFVIEVEAEDPTQTEAIARALIEPLRDDYDEILVYVNSLGDDSNLPARRIQWTPGGGYREITYDQP